MHLDLFSGIGGFSLASQWVGGIQTTQFVEIDPFCQKVLNKNFPGVPIHDDVTTFTAKLGQFDILTGGFPCQDISAAGHQKGIQQGTRSGLFFEIVRIVRECRPKYLLLENVPAIFSSNDGQDFGTVLWELSQLGYDAEWQLISANALGANHKRERCWIIAYPKSFGCKLSERDQHKTEQKWGMVLADIERKVYDMPYKSPRLFEAPRSFNVARIPRADDGLSRRVDNRSRIKALGNSIVPQVAEIPLRRILHIESQLRQSHVTQI
jgi:DNA (cytosine-5)-methyltransferase 1